MRNHQIHGAAVGVFVALLALSLPLGAQVLPPASAAGTVGATAGGPFDVLLVNGSAGGVSRTVRIGVSQPLTFSVQQPPAATGPSPFVIFGFAGTPGPGDEVVLPPPLNGAIFAPCFMAPTNPALFNFTDNLGVGGCLTLLPSTPAPWTQPVVFGVPIPITIALQGAILDPSSPIGVSMTNAVYVQIVDERMQPIYTKIAGDPSAQVPGALNLAGQPVSTEFRAFERLIGTPYGQWMVKARTQLGSDLETCLMLGFDTAGTLFAQEGQPIHGGLPGEVYDFFGSGVGRFDDLGDFAYSARARGGSSAIHQKVIKVVGGVGSVVTQQGDLLTGLVDDPAGSSGDEAVGNSVGSIHLLNSGAIGSQDSTIQNISSLRRPAIFYDNAAFHQRNVTTVTGLDGVSIETWDTLDSNNFYTTPDGARWMARGRVIAPSTSDSVLVVDGQVALQEGHAIPGTTLTVSSITSYDLQGNGTWIARGALDTGEVFAARLGQVIARTGDALFPGSLENWGTSYTAVAGNRVGDWVIAGRTDSGIDVIDDVLVASTGKVLVREGDAVDLDQNGFYDDNVFIGRGDPTLTTWSANNVFVTDDGWVYFLASLNDGLGNDLNCVPAFSTPLALLRVRLTHP